MAELVASDLDQAMPQVASALAVQHMRNPMSDTGRQTFGLPGQVRSARVDYFSLGEELGMGGTRVGALSGVTFGEDDHQAWSTDREYRYLDELRGGQTQSGRSCSAVPWWRSTSSAMRSCPGSRISRCWPPSLR